MEKPVNSWVNARGKTVNVFATDKPFVFRAFVDGKPFTLDKCKPTKKV